MPSVDQRESTEPSGAARTGGVVHFHGLFSRVIMRNIWDRAEGGRGRSTWGSPGRKRSATVGWVASSATHRAHVEMERRRVRKCFNPREGSKRALQGS